MENHLADAGEAGPVDVGERVVLLDVLRGLALGGVFLANTYSFLSGRAFLPPDQLRASIAHPLDAAMTHAVIFFVSGKFITIFSFLFGLGFSIQMLRAEERGTSGPRLFARRLTFMLLFGAAHAVTLWYGDILHVYALLGFSLLLLRKRSDRALLTWGLLCAAILPGAIDLAIHFLPRLWTSPEAAEASMNASMAQVAESKRQALPVHQGDSYLAVVRMNPRIYWDLFGGLRMIGFAVGVLGRFMLGLYVGRRGLLHDAATHRPLFRQLLGWGFLFGLIGNGAALVMRQLSISGRLAPSSLAPQIVGPLSRDLGHVGFAVLYVAAIALLFQRDRWRRLLLVFAPVGRMALTNYLAQSLLAVLIFYGIGLGLIGQVRPALVVAIVAGIFSLQIAWSHLWLARFRMGPAEWLWRSLTYGKLQPMRLPRGAAGLDAPEAEITGRPQSG